MKIKKSNVAMVEKWIDIQLAKDDKFPFDQDESSKASKKHLKALKAWRKCTRNAKEVREWCDEWLDEEYTEKLWSSIENNRSHKADHTLKLTQDAYERLITEADELDLSPSELIISLLPSDKS